MVLHELCLAYTVHEQRHLLFSAIHLDALIRATIQAGTRQSTATFHVIRATCEGNEVDESLGQHLRAFLDMDTVHKLSNADIVSFIASALLLDGYPLGMYCQQRLCPSLNLVLI
jgi:hypothetical protein